jgi:membrane-associated phospholipid phosphatase
VKIHPASGSLPLDPARRRPASAPAGFQNTGRVTLAIGILLGLFGVLLFDVLLGGPLTRLDGRVATSVNRADVSHPLVVHAARWATFVGSTVVVGSVIAAAALYWFLTHRRRLSLFVIATAVSGLILNNAIKLAVSRDRPLVLHAVAHASGKSFPSGHAMNSAVVYGVVLVAAMWNVADWRRRYMAAAGVVLLVSVIAASRVVLDVHYVTDVVAGASLGAAIVLISAKAFSGRLIADGRTAEQVR